MIPSHITIIEPTAMNIYDIPALIVQFDNACDQVPAFSINLAGTGTFRPVSPVVYLQMAAGATECTALNNAANRGLVATKPRFPFHPHVTLAQDVPPEALDQAQLDFANFTANFKVEALWLYRQGDDGVWRKNCKFDLRG
jgi:2'-5' RNA ligase